ncbi:PQQ-binding-like beta-propeller repeat protein [Adhaeribacter aquaticus]|uniref:outer membrane protein assembly factor BamB family protein n=1 Tax=Adhaeribacter aquaticus TaxID=299567 RepID=UPI0003F66034|nr:PQQ-binding-like beta-propeller repeat protein [Adhaeribacter aquaticus]
MFFNNCNIKKITKGGFSVNIQLTLLLALSLGCSKTTKQSLIGETNSSGNNQHKTWKDYGGGPDQSKYVLQKEINKSNVNQLKVAWFYPTGDKSQYQFNPIIVDNVMFVLAKNNSLVALNATTGEEIWIHANLQGISRRGLNYWESKDRKDRRLLFMMNNNLQAIDAQTGKSILTFGNNGIVDLREGLGRDPKTISRAQSSGPGRIYENLIMLGSATGEDYFSTPGHLRAFDVETGKLVWTFHTIPQPGEYGYETWPKDAYKYIGGANTWGEISLDEKRGIAYFPVGSPTYDYYGADRIGSNLYGTSLVALDARTGKRIWHFQLVHHDIWDYDPTAAPQLITLNHKGKKIDAVAQATKHGYLFVFNRETGEPLWPVEERPVPPSDVPGEKAWPTQPFPTGLPTFLRQKMTVEDLSPYFLTSAERETWTKRIQAAKTGLFTPPSLNYETIAVPGAVGGANWGNTAANPEKGMVYILAQDFPSFYKLEKRTASPGPMAAANNALLQKGQTHYTQNCQACHGADRQGLNGPPLVNVGNKFNFENFQQVVVSGRGQMPAFQHIDEGSLREIYRFLGGNLGNPAGGGAPGGLGLNAGSVTLPSGPVVASGGAPGGQALKRAVDPLKAYPEGVDAPKDKYFTNYGLGFPHIMMPPWSSIVAYDLNKGIIKWKKPLGQDLLATQAGAKNTGVPRGSQRSGMIVTSNGIIFSTAKDGKIYAFDADNGETLWTGELPTGTEGLPSMYEVNGKHYLVVNASTPLTWGPKSRESGIGAEGPQPQGGYVVFALPNN